MFVRDLSENVIADIGHAFGYYDYGAERGLVSAFSEKENAAAYIRGYHVPRMLGSWDFWNCNTFASCDRRYS